MMPSQKDDPALLGYCRLAFETNLRNKSKYKYLLVQMILTQELLLLQMLQYILYWESLSKITDAVCPGLDPFIWRQKSYIQMVTDLYI